MNDTRVTEGLRLSEIQVKKVKLFIDTMERQLEFEDNGRARRHIASLQETLNYTEKLLKRLRVIAVGFSLRKGP